MLLYIGMKYLVKFTDSNIQNTILNICILLFGINFLYKCNYIVMITFILLLFFKKFKISYQNIVTLVILVLFAISWYIFTDGHEIAGVCLPICYLIGSNIDDKDEKGITKFILLISMSLAFYTTLFFVNNAITNGITSYDVYNQQNIWTGQPLWATNIMLYSSLFFSCFGYVVFEEKDLKMKVLYFVIFIINAFYALMLGRRAALLMIILSFTFSFIYKVIIEDKDSRKKIFKLTIAICSLGIFLLVLLLIMFKTNAFGIKEIIKSTDLYVRFIRPHKIMYFFRDSGRMNIRINYFKHFFDYMWGGNVLRDIVGNYAHDLWLDVYDVAGIVSFVIIIIYSIIFVFDAVKICTNKSISHAFRLFVICLFICIVSQMFLEPILEACRAYMFGVCMIHGSLVLIKK